MATYEIPLSPEAQTFKISLSGVTYIILLYWNFQASVWVIDLSDRDGNSILSGIPVVANVDLLGSFGYLGIGGQLIARTEGAIDTPPTYSNLGTSGKLFFITNGV